MRSRNVNHSRHSQQLIAACVVVVVLLAIPLHGATQTVVQPQEHEHMAACAAAMQSHDWPTAVQSCRDAAQDHIYDGGATTGYAHCVFALLVASEFMNVGTARRALGDTVKAYKMVTASRDDFQYVIDHCPYSDIQNKAKQGLPLAQRLLNEL